MRLQAVTLVVPDHDQGIAFFVGGLDFRWFSDEGRRDGKRWVLVEPPDGGAPLLLAKAAGADQEAVDWRAADSLSSFGPTTSKLRLLASLPQACALRRSHGARSTASSLSGAILGGIAGISSALRDLAARFAGVIARRAAAWLTQET